MKLAAILLAAVSMPIAGTAFAPIRADAAPPASPAAHPYAPQVAEAAQRFDIPPDWIWQVMRAESRGKPRAVSHAGAMGLMQIMPATWAMLSERYRLGSDPFDVRANIHGGAAYLRMMWDRYRDVTLNNPKYRGLVQGKLDWMLLSNLKTVHTDIFNHDYKASDHKGLVAHVQLRTVSSADEFFKKDLPHFWGEFAPYLVVRLGFVLALLWTVSWLWTWRWI